jgi:hypothetical protein
VSRNRKYVGVVTSKLQNGFDKVWCREVCMLSGDNMSIMYPSSV